MIEPLRFNHEKAPTYEINRPVFCQSCLLDRKRKNRPNVSVKFCQHCPTSLGTDKGYGAFICKFCDEVNHSVATAKHHIRQILVLGPGVRKKVLVRGDGKNFPVTLDEVKIRIKSRVYHNGKKIHSESKKTLNFVSGMSGKCIHVQVLGARNIQKADLHGSSDSYFVYSFHGKQLHSTRVRPRTLNPRWDNETFLVPVDDNLPPPRNLIPSQKDLIKLEVYDYDWFTKSDYLGHLEMPKSKLLKLAIISNEKPIKLPLTFKEHHGLLNLQLGFNKDFVFIKLVNAINLDTSDTVNFSNPYAKVFLGGHDTLIGTTPVVRGTINPVWTGSNEFKIKTLQLLFTERFLQSKIELYLEAEKQKKRQGLSGRKGILSRPNPQLKQSIFNEFLELPDDLALFRVELYDKKTFGRDKSLGSTVIPLPYLRKLLPTFPAQEDVDLKDYASFASKKHVKVKNPVDLFRKSYYLIQECFSGFFNKKESYTQRSGVIKKEVEENEGFEENRDKPTNLSVSAPYVPPPKRVSVYGSFSDVNMGPPPPDPVLMNQQEITSISTSDKVKDAALAAVEAFIKSPRTNSTEVEQGLESGIMLGMQRRRKKNSTGTSGSDLENISSNADNIPNEKDIGIKIDPTVKNSFIVADEMDGVYPPMERVNSPFDGVNDSIDRVNEDDGILSSLPLEDSYANLPSSAASNSLVEDSTNHTDNSGLLSRPLSKSQSIRSKAQSLRKAISMKFNIPATEWSPLCSIPVMRESTKAYWMKERGIGGIPMPKKDKGSVILRLIPSSRGTVLAGLDQVVRQMTIGETARVKCRFDYAYGNYCIGVGFPPRSNIIFTVELLAINGSGKFSMPYRQVLRFYRAIKRFNEWLCGVCWDKKKRMAYLHGSKTKSKHHRHYHGRLMQWFGMGTKNGEDEESVQSRSYSGSDNESESSDDESGSYDDDDDEYSNSNDDQFDLNHMHRIKPAKNVKKYLNNSVYTGSKILWGYSPPPEEKTQKIRKKRVKQKRQDGSEGSNSMSLQEYEGSQSQSQSQSLYSNSYKSSGSENENINENDNEWDENEGSEQNDQLLEEAADDDDDDGSDYDEFGNKVGFSEGSEDENEGQSLLKRRRK